MADDWGALIRRCLLILLVVGLLMSGNGRPLVDAAVAESRHFSTVPFSSLMREADGLGSLSSGHAGEFSVVPLYLCLLGVIFQYVDSYSLIEKIEWGFFCSFRTRQSSFNPRSSSQPKYSAS